MLVNLSYDLDYVVNTIKSKFTNEVIFDITGELQNVNIPNKVLFARELDRDHSIEKKSIETYVQYISEIGNTDVRNIIFNGLPIWWLTEMSEKHDRNHWGQRVFFFLEFIRVKSQMFIDDVQIILPDFNKGLGLFIEKSIEIKNINVKFLYPKTFRVNILKKYSKCILYYFIYKVRLYLTKKADKVDEADAFFINFNVSNSNLNNNDFNIGWLKELLVNENLVVYNLPYPVFECLNKIDLQKKNNFYFSQFSPSFFKIVQILIKGIVFNFKLNTILNIRNIEDYEKLMLQVEFKKVFTKPHLFLSYEWLKNISIELNNKTFLYSDELYVSGRVFSSALNNGKNYTIGVQHGIISNNHTVYRITNAECENENAIPLPSKIMLWNKLFGEIITQSCSFLNKKIVYSSDYHYCEMINRISKEKKKIKSKLTILWATTIWEHFVKEYEIIKLIFELKYINVIIRLHPKGHITKEMVNKKLNGKSYKIDSYQYSQTLANSDIVLSNTFSTVIYDCYKLNIPVVRIEHLGTFNDFNINNSLVFSVSSRIKFDETLENIIKEKINLKNV